MKRDKIHLRFDSVTGAHTKVTVFVRGANCGQLTLKNEEAIWFHHIVWKGCEALKFDWVASGRGPDEEQATPELVSQCAEDLDSKEKERLA